ncbi:MAG: GNAT family N-acetyltransferase [Trueperaceae bacterium]|nr:GNAT family N-acetyltransferase [Trueperaceae bacterium]
MTTYRYFSFDSSVERKLFDDTFVTALVDFLSDHLDDYGDTPEDIRRCLDYATSDAEGKGGAVLLALAADETRGDDVAPTDIYGAVVCNATGMHGYIPENILVYIAVRRDQRGQGIGQEMMKQVLEHLSGSVALHVEPDNPAKALYEKLGFTAKYLEMRLYR